MAKSILDQKEAAKLKKGGHTELGEWQPVSRTPLIVNDPATTASFTRNAHLKQYASWFPLCAQWGSKSGNFKLKKKKKKPASDLNIISLKTIGSDFENLLYRWTST